MTIIVKILGGMGNQMFQYAAAKSLALRFKTELILDIDSLNRHGERPFDLIHFNIPDKVATPSDFKKLGWGFLAYPLIKLKKHPQYYFEKEFTFNNQFGDFTPPLYLDGYFQSEKYFLNIQAELKKFLVFKALTNDNEKNIMNKIGGMTPISLHVRRGDYVTNPNAQSQMGNLGLDYYEKAMRLLEEKVSDPFYLIFSDDAEWVKSHLKIRKSHHFVIGNTGTEAFRDMRLMSQCHHHIIANSSFSWWGAWLNDKSDKIVVAPKIWFRDGTNDCDLIPANWLRV